MSKRKSFAGRSKDEESSGYEDFSGMSDFDYMLQSSHTPKGKAKDEAGDEMVRCRYCLKDSMQLRALPRHFKRRHPSFYKMNKDASRADIRALKGQTTPEDPEY